MYVIMRATRARISTEGGRKGCAKMAEKKKIKVRNTRLRKRKERRDTGGGCVETGRLASPSNRRRPRAAARDPSAVIGRHRPFPAALGRASTALADARPRVAKSVSRTLPRP